MGPLSPILLLIALLTAAGLVALALAPIARRLPTIVWIAIGGVVFLVLLLPYDTASALFPEPSALGPPSFVSLQAVMMIPAPLLVAAVLFGVALKRAGEIPAGADAASAGDRSNALTAAALILAVLLVAKALQDLYWLTIWDNTYDPLGYLWLGIPILAVVASSVLLVLLPPHRLLVAVGYAVALTGLLIAVSARAQATDFRRLTQERARRVVLAIGAYHERQGRFPRDLAELTPWTLLSLPAPVILFGQGWCYDSGPAFYRLGYVDRDHWSDPRLKGHVVHSEGPTAGLPAECGAEIADLKSRYPGFSDEVVKDYTG